jgi:hypothetical protein
MVPSGSTPPLVARTGPVLLVINSLVGYEPRDGLLICIEEFVSVPAPRCGAPASRTAWRPEEGVGTTRRNHRTYCSCRLQSTARELP